MKHLLLIEPDLHLGEIYTQALEAAGHQVSYAPGAQAAIKLADSRLPDMVIMELELATHNGVEFLYEFRSYPDWQNIPVIVLSFQRPAASLLARTAWSKLGVVRYHYKPATNLKLLLSSIKQLLDTPIAAVPES